jgi:hypothetical protein
MIASSGLLGTLENQIPDSIHNALAAVQEGVFIPSAIVCFILLCHNFYHQYSGHRLNHQYGCLRIFLILTVAVIAFIFCIATFVAQIIAYNMLKDNINQAKGSTFGGLFTNVVNITTKFGSSVWMSLAAFICLFLVIVLLALNSCCFNRDRKRIRKGNGYEMSTVAE